MQANLTGSSPIRILVTGFGSFPGVPQNPTARLVAALARQRARFVRLGVDLHLCVLPVTYFGAPETMEALISSLRPHAVLHFGYAVRRRAVCVETRALNHASVLRADANGSSPSRASIDEAPFVAVSALPYRRIAVSFRRAGLKSAVSIDAGDYVCNHIFLRSLMAMKTGAAGFVHIPPVRRAGQQRSALPSHRPDFETVGRAAFFAILETARSLRAAHARPPGLDPRAQGA
ncbi:hypothetical protein [Methylocapsa palsarum]|uniref:pyroglutamyl-peptidase I family protein n=1 Tax=Methylocapsa palsarum TaxID=1612308 RepID=UPI001587D8A9|nr:hypothetical protein [Methylocapsa palsarum]